MLFPKCEVKGWSIALETGGIKFGGSVTSSINADCFSVDVKLMKNAQGQHYMNSNCKIGAIFPKEGNAKFDCIPEGWYVYLPSCDHLPNMTAGDAHVLNFSPDRATVFSGN